MPSFCDIETGDWVEIELVASFTDDPLAGAVLRGRVQDEEKFLHEGEPVRLCLVSGFWFSNEDNILDHRKG